MVACARQTPARRSSRARGSPVNWSKRVDPALGAVLASSSDAVADLAAGQPADHHGGREQQREEPNRVLAGALASRP